MALPLAETHLTEEELAGLVVVAAVVAALLGPRAITLADGGSVAVTAVSVAVTGLLAFLTGAVALVAVRRASG